MGKMRLGFGVMWTMIVDIRGLKCKIFCGMGGGGRVSFSEFKVTLKKERMPC
jgi:hypothetical protein